MDKPRIDAFICGVQKTGTSWVARQLNQHPSIAVTDPKETDFLHGVKFDHHDPADWARYAQMVRPGDVQVDASVSLFTERPETPRFAAEHYPEARFVVVLRDPVRRAYSHFWHNNRKYAKGSLGPEDFPRYLHKWRLFHRGLYGLHTARWFSVLDASSFGFFDYETLTARDAEEWRRLHEFLGVEPRPLPATASEPFLPREGESGLVGRADATARRLRRIGMGKLVDSLKRRGIEDWLNRKAIKRHAYPPLSAETYAQIRPRFDADARRFVDLTGHDPRPLWSGPG